MCASVYSPLLIIALSLPPVSPVPQITRRPVTDLPNIAELPDPFTGINGSAVRSTFDWDCRRAELKGLFQAYIYGSLPAKPE